MMKFILQAQRAIQAITRTNLVQNFNTLYSINNTRFFSNSSLPSSEQEVKSKLIDIRDKETFKKELKDLLLVYLYEEAIICRLEYYIYNSGWELKDSHTFNIYLEKTGLCDIELDDLHLPSYIEDMYNYIIKDIDLSLDSKSTSVKVKVVELFTEIPVKCYSSTRNNKIQSYNVKYNDIKGKRHFSTSNCMFEDKVELIPNINKQYFERELKDLLLPCLKEDYTYKLQYAMKNDKGNLIWKRTDFFNRWLVPDLDLYIEDVSSTLHLDVIDTVDCEYIGIKFSKLYISGVKLNDFNVINNLINSCNKGYKKINKGYKKSYYRNKYRFYNVINRCFYSTNSFSPTHHHPKCILMHTNNTHYTQYNLRVFQSLRLLHSSNTSYKNNYWQTYHSLKEYDIIGPNTLKEELELFFKYYSDNYKESFFAILFKIKFSNGDVRTCSNSQVTHLNDFDKVYSKLSFVFNYENIYEKVSEDHGKDDLFIDGLPIGNIIFDFKPLSKIENTKYSDYIPNNKQNIQKNMIYKEDKNILNDFKYKGYILPSTMDLTLWPNIEFDEEFKTAYSSYHNKTMDINLDFVIYISKCKYSVFVKNRGKVMFTFTDTSLNNNNDLNIFSRTIIEDNRKKIYYFNNGKVELYKTWMKTAFITKKSKDIINQNSSKILTLDLETKLDNSNKMIPVCMSIYDGEKAITFMFNLDSWQNDMANAIRTLMRRKYDNYRIYIHNLSYFDSIFMIDVLSQLGTLYPFMKDNKILKLTFKYNTEKGRKCVINFYDSLLILPDSLANLSRSFKIETPKSIFPLLFLNREDFNINYIGSVPEYKYFYSAYTDKFTKLDYNNYCNKFKDKKWELSVELAKYCEIDTVSLYQIIIKFQNEIYGLFKVDITKYPTLASIAFGIYRTNFLKDNTIPRILSKLHNSLKQSYFGGITEVYKGSGRNINSYDVNSLYPYSMKYFPMPTGSPIHFVGNIYNSVNESKPFGFFKVNITAPCNINKPFLPTRINTNNGTRTIFPVGTWTGWYFSEELQNAKKYGYDFEVLEGYLFSKKLIFSDYIDVLYKIKSESDSSDPKYYIAKLLMNALYGRFGLNPDFNVVKIVTSEESENILVNENNVKVIPLVSGKVMVIYEKDRESLEINNISVTISSAIASYSRICMSHYLQKYNDNLYAIDTDGIKLSTQLDENEIDNKMLGKMKYEFTFSEAVFPAPKVYGGLLTKPYKKYKKELVKIKGLKNTIPYVILKSINNKNTKYEIKQEKWIRELENSTIVVKNESYTLSLTENKREIVYDSLGNFIDSIPLYLEKGEIIKRNPDIIKYLPAPNSQNSDT
jgi:hypothetical protein